jgi:transposase
MRSDKERLREFKEIKEAIRKDPNYLVIGIDVAKVKHHACFTLSSGRILAKDIPFSNTRYGFERLFKEIQRYGSNDVSGIICGLESTGNYQKPLADYLSHKGLNVVLVSTLAVSQNRQMLNVSWDKSDKKDAFNIADLIGQGKFLFHQFEEERYSNASRMLRVYMRLVKEQSRLKVKLRNSILSVVFPELDRIFKDIGNPAVLNILEKYPTPSQIRELSDHEFIYSVLPRRHSSRYLPRIKSAYQAAKESIGSEIGINGILRELSYILKDIREVGRRIREIKVAIKDIFSNFPPYQRLLTIPGVGPMVAATFLAEIGDINCYVHADQIIKLAGLDLASIQSGKYQSQRKISKRGKVRLRTAAYRAAIASVRPNNGFRRKYLQIVERKSGDGGAKMKALIAVATKILRIVFRLLKDGTTYNEDYAG